MWPKFYKDYPVDEPLIKYPVEPDHGIIGCEMHEIFGWGESYHIYKPRKKGFFKRIFSFFTKKKVK